MLYLAAPIVAAKFVLAFLVLVTQEQLPNLPVAKVADGFGLFTVSKSFFICSFAFLIKTNAISSGSSVLADRASTVDRERSSTVLKFALTTLPSFPQEVFIHYPI